MRINIKPMSINEAYNGQRTKSKAYKSYINACLISLKKITIPENKLWLTLVIGVSNRGFDIDNAVKPFLDILQKKYGFNDNRVYVLHVKKEIVKKGNEFLDFEIVEWIE